MTALRYRPYLSGTNPFSIGLSALPPEGWIEPDGDLHAFLDEKARLRAEVPDAVFQAVDGSGPAQQECLDLLARHLETDHAGLYRRDGTHMVFGSRSIDLAAADRPPLLTAGSLVADDLVILERRDAGWHVTAGYVAFPSSWSLREKIGLPMEGVHQPVPGFGAGTRNAGMINRIFDNLKPDMPAMRMNWSIYPEGDLYWPPEHGLRQKGRPFTPSSNFLRVERQTLRRLPRTGGIVFTIRIYADPIARLAGLPDSGRVAGAVVERLMDLSPEQLAYKGMQDRRDALVSYLRSIK